MKGLGIHKIFAWSQGGSGQQSICGGGGVVVCDLYTMGGESIGQYSSLRFF